MQEKGPYISCPVSFNNNEHMSDGQIVSVTDLDSLGGHYRVRFNALGTMGI